MKKSTQTKFTNYLYWLVIAGLCVVIGMRAVIEDGSEVGTTAFLQISATEAIAWLLVFSITGFILHRMSRRIN